MKRVILLVCALLTAFVLSACAQDTNDEIAFKGTIIELNGGSAIVEPDEGESVRGSADKIIVDLSSCDVEFAPGDRIKVIYDGAVMESYPAQVNVLGVEKID